LPESSEHWHNDENCFIIDVVYQTESNNCQRLNH